MSDKDYGIPEQYKFGGLQNQPDNTNLTAPTNFKLILPKIPNVTFFCTAIALPGQSCPPLVYKTQISQLKVPGNTISHGDLNFTFLVDEKLENMKELQAWFSSMLAFNDFQNLASISDWMSNEGQVIFLSNKKTPILRMTFRGLFPVSISPITFKTTDQESSTMTALCTMAFTYFELEKM